jgi:hypothetical protein
MPTSCSRSCFSSSGRHSTPGSKSRVEIQKSTRGNSFCNQSFNASAIRRPRSPDQLTKTFWAYPETLRRITYVDPDTLKRFRFLTNNFVLPAITIAIIYKSRWQVELFFKWIKQHLRIKAFYGTSENAVKTQIWIAVSVYVLVAIVRKRLDLDASLYQIL